MARNCGRRTFVERLNANADELELAMQGYLEHLVFVVSGGHPEGEPAIRNEGACREREDVVEEREEGVRFPGRDVGGVSR